MEKNKNWVSYYEFLTDVSKRAFPFYEKEKVPSLDRRFTYNLNYSLISIIQSYLKLYFKEADSVIDLTYYKISVNGIEKNEKEWIKVMIDICDKLLSWDDFRAYNDEYKENLHYFFQILEAIFPGLWW